MRANNFNNSMIKKFITFIKIIAIIIMLINRTININYKKLIIMIIIMLIVIIILILIVITILIIKIIINYSNNNNNVLKSCLIL